MSVESLFASKYKNQRRIMVHRSPHLKVEMWATRLQMNLLSSDRVTKSQKLGVQKISPIAGEAGKILKGLAA